MRGRATGRLCVVLVDAVSRGVCMALVISRLRRLELLDLGERKAGTFGNLFQHKFPVGEQSLRRRDHGLTLAARFTALCEFFYCFAHDVPPFI